MIERKHDQNRIPDYVLGLLSRQERQQVEKHAATCDACNRRLQAEMALSRIVRHALHAVTQPPNGRLARLMPPVPKRQPGLLANLTWQKQLASACVLFILLLGGAGIYQSNQYSTWNAPPAFLAATATFTAEPTATSTKETVEPTSTVVVEQPALQQQHTPPPSATPLAAIHFGNQ